MLSIKLKHISDTIDIVEVIKEYSKTLNLQKNVATIIESAISIVKDDRLRLRSLTHSTEQKDIDLLLRHYKHSVLLTNQVPWDSKIMCKIMKNIAPRGFNWIDRNASAAIDAPINKCPTATCRSISLDALSCLFNLGAMYSYHGTSRDMTNTEDLSAASNDFFTAAYYFSQAAEYVYNYSSTLGDELTFDLSPQVLKAFSLLMVSQGVETLATRVNLVNPNAIISVTQFLYDGAAKFYAKTDSSFSVDQLAVYLPPSIQFVPRLQSAFYSIRRTHELADNFYQQAIDGNSDSIDSDIIAMKLSAAMYFIRECVSVCNRLEEILNKPSNQKTINSLPKVITQRYGLEIGAVRTLEKQIEELSKIYVTATPSIDSKLEFSTVPPQKILERMSQKVFIENNKHIVDALQLPDDEANPFRDLVNKDLVGLSENLPNDIYKEVQRMLSMKVSGLPAFVRFNTSMTSYNNDVAKKNKFARTVILPAVVLQSNSMADDASVIPTEVVDSESESVEMTAVDDTHNNDYKNDMAILSDLVEAIKNGSLTSEDDLAERKLAQILGSENAADCIVKSANLVGSYAPNGDNEMTVEGTEANPEAPVDAPVEEEPIFDEKNPLSLLSGDIAELGNLVNKTKTSFPKSINDIMGELADNETRKHRNILAMCDSTDAAIRTLINSDNANIQSFGGRLKTNVFRGCVDSLDKQTKNIVHQLQVGTETVKYIKTSYEGMQKTPEILGLVNGTTTVEDAVMKGVNEEIKKAQDEILKANAEKAKSKELAASTLSPKEQKEMEKRKAQDDEYNTKITESVEKLNQKAEEILAAIAECRIALYQKTTNECTLDVSKLQGMLKDTQFYLDDKNNAKKCKENINAMKSVNPLLAAKPDFYIQTLREISTSMANTVNVETQKLSKLLNEKELVYTQLYSQIDATVKNRKKILDDRARADAKNKKNAKSTKLPGEEAKPLDPTDRGMAVAMNNIDELKKKLGQLTTVIKLAADVNTFYTNAEQTIAALKDNTNRITGDYNRDIQIAAEDISYGRKYNVEITSGSGYIPYH